MPHEARSRAWILFAVMLAVLLGAALLVRRTAPGRLANASPSATAQAPPEPPAAPDRTPEIRGKILDADGNAVVGAAVRLVSPRPPYTVLRETRSEQGGSFSFDHVRQEHMHVVADHDPDGVVSSAELHVADGQTLEVTLVLSLASAVHGTVVDTQDRPVAGAALSVEGVPWSVRSATTDEGGGFRLVAVPDEATSLVAVARGYKTARVAMPPGRRTELVVRLRLVAAPPVEGDVRDVDGNPVGARVVACEGQPAEARTASAEDGTFQLPPSAIGCDAVALHDELGPSDPVAVVEGRHVRLRLKAGGSIEGVVVDEHGTGVAAFTVGIESFTGPHARSSRGGGRRTFEDPRGAFRWDKLQPGTYVLTAAAPGGAPARSDAVDVAGGVTTKGVRIVLVPGGSVTGHVYDERHAPLAAVDLRFDAVSSVLDSPQRARTDDAGKYRLDGAPQGPFTLRLQKEGYRIRLLSGLRVDARSTLTQDVTLAAVDGGGGIELGGVGATLVQTREGISFGNVFPGDPAERAGLRAGDRILRVDGEDADGMSIADVLQRLRGQAGTSVGVSVQRPDTGETLDVLIVRAVIVR